MDRWLGAPVCVLLMGIAMIVLATTPPSNPAATAPSGPRQWLS